MTTLRYHLRLACLSVILSVATFGTLPAQDAKKIPLTILHYNDFHSQNTPYTIPKTDKAGVRTMVEVGGSAVLKGYIQKNSSEAANVIVLHAGDDFQGSPICALTKGKSQIELLQLMRPDAMTIGNHEFDYGADVLQSYFPLLHFPLVSANLWDKSKGEYFVKPYDTLVRSGMTIGVIGLAPRGLKTLTMRENVQNLDVLDVNAAVKKAMSELREKYRAKLIVVLSHLGAEEDSALAVDVSGIDVIVGGHSHTTMFKPKLVHNTIIVQAGSKGRWLGKLQLLVDTVKSTCEMESGMLIETRTDRITPDPVVAKKVTELEKQIDSKFSEVIGTLATDWTRSHGPAESNIGNWQADVIRDHTHADVALQNSGGIRKDLVAGPITVRDIWEISPFDNEISTFSITGKQLLSLLAFQGNKEREFCQVSGVKYRYDRTAPPESALTATVDGKPIDPAKTYLIATNSYIAGHLHDAFNLPEAEITVQPVSPGRACREIFIDYIRAQKNITSSLEGRITIITK